jgi:hypothetical protein
MEAVPGTDGSHLSRNTTHRPDSERLAGGAEDLRHVSRKETASAPPRPSGTRARDPNTGGSRCGRGGPAGHPRPRRARPGGRGGGRRATAPHGGGRRRGRRSPGARSAAPGRPVPAAPTHRTPRRGAARPPPGRPGRRPSGTPPGTPMGRLGESASPLGESLGESAPDGRPRRARPAPSIGQPQSGGGAWESNPPAAARTTAHRF